MNAVVFAPDFIGASFIDPSARAVIERWRDGAFKVVTNRQLLVLHLRTLHRLGLPHELIKRWTLWLTCPEKTIFLAEVAAEKSQPITLCEFLAQSIGSRGIVCWRKPEGAAGAWFSAAKFLEQKT